MNLSKARNAYLRWKDTAFMAVIVGLFILGLIQEIPILSSISWGIFLVLEVVFRVIGTLWSMFHYV